MINTFEQYLDYIDFYEIGLLQQICEIPPKLPLITTQTFILEQNGITFNECLLDVIVLEKLLKNAHKQYNLRQLVFVQTKKIQIVIDNGKIVSSERCPNKRTMNASILFMFRSRWSENKYIYLRMFRNGKIQVPGLVSLFHIFEVRSFVYKVFKMLDQNTQPNYPPPIFHNVMQNYKAAMLDENLCIRFDLDAVLCLLQKSSNMDRFHTDKHQIMILGWVKNRPVLLIKLKIDKIDILYKQMNHLSTHQKKEVKMVTIQLTQRGKILYQGFTNNFELNFQIINRFTQFIQDNLDEILVTCAVDGK